jgi:hypothetical protein
MGEGMSDWKFREEFFKERARSLRQKACELEDEACRYDDMADDARLMGEFCEDAPARSPSLSRFTEFQRGKTG